MAVHGTPRFAGGVHEFVLSPPTVLRICGSLARRMRCTFVAGLCHPRLHIPVFRNLFFGSKKTFLPGFLRISLFSCVFRRNFSQERGFGGGRRNSCFLLLSQEFFAGIPVGQEFLYLLWIPPNSSGFLFPPKLSGSGQRLKKALC